MTNSLNTFLSLYRLIRKQRYANIAPQLEQLTELITQSVNVIAQQEQVLLKIESATLSGFRYSLSLSTGQKTQNVNKVHLTSIEVK